MTATRATAAPGTATAYDDAGHGPAVVLLHGHPFDRSMWWPQRERLAAAGWRVVVPDLRGYGETPGDDACTPLEVFAGDLLALLDELDIESFALGGLSMGGQIALATHRLLRERSEQYRLRELLIAASSPLPEDAAGVVARHATADRLLTEGMHGFAGEMLPRMLAPGSIRTLPATVRHVHRMMTTAPAQGAAAALRGRAMRPDYRPELTEIAVPTLVVVGDHDTVTPVPVARDMADAVPRGRLLVLDGTAHLPNLEHEVAFNDAVQHFLGALDR
ncbi:alpha/beta fold hydrolase [Prauserella alba]|uniref:Alpha/beta fold hydrolase n=1 Tax=Prauserella alba TaxID=176898 RepID=A0ABP4GBT4_9PSEU|nr:alpha/beta fold hydrolase [Prauserella alba]MCP2180729.1 Pimeloyl-ACP methyl ester carboxylesterase [Prauserella alba]